MSEQKSYHAAIEIKSIVSYHLRHTLGIRRIVEECEDASLIRLFDESEQTCQKLFDLASKIADDNRIETPIPNYADRGIDEFLSGSSRGSSGDCDGECDNDCDGSCGGCKS